MDQSHQKTAGSAAYYTKTPRIYSLNLSKTVKKYIFTRIARKSRYYCSSDGRNVAIYMKVAFRYQKFQKTHRSTPLNPNFHSIPSELRILTDKNHIFSCCRRYLINENARSAVSTPGTLLVASSVIPNPKFMQVRMANSQIIVFLNQN